MAIQKTKDPKIREHDVVVTSTIYLSKERKKDTTTNIITKYNS